MCSRTLSDAANRLRKTRKKKSSAVPLFRSGHMSAICARPSKGKGRFTRGWKPQVSTLLCPRRVGARPAEVQRKTSRPLGANTLTQFEHPGQPVLKKGCRPPGANTPAAVRVPRSAGAEKTAAQTGAKSRRLLTVYPLYFPVRLDTIGL